MTTTHLCMRSFIVEGVLGGARAGMTRDAIAATLGSPDDWSAGKSIARADIWRYGTFEVHFDRDIAVLLYTDYLDPLDAGPGRTLDPWILAEGTLSIGDTLTRLTTLGVPFDLLEKDLIVRIRGGADLSFLDANDPIDGRDEWHGIAVRRT